MKLWWQILCVGLLCLLPVFIPALSEAEGDSRMLLVGCDHFLTQEDTSPSSKLNVEQMERALGGGILNVQKVTSVSEGVSGYEELRRLIRETFQDAQEGDVSYFYISTHGLWQEAEPNESMTLLLSDGVEEGGITARELYDCLETVPGTKVLILDACHSGAMIGKGELTSFSHLFEGSQYKIICSSGGCEDSWFWSGQASGLSEIYGGGYFSSVLALGISRESGYAADRNHDGLLTLSEIKHYMLEMHGASTVCIYPEEDDFPILRYDTEQDRDITAPVGNFAFEESLLSGEHPEISFSFTVYGTIRMAYQIVEWVDGRWDFAHSEVHYDMGEMYGPYGDAPGYLMPGFKERTIMLRSDQQEGGYVLLQMVVSWDRHMSIMGSKVICVPPVQADPHVRVRVDASARLSTGGEIGVVIYHDCPMEYDMVLEDLSGGTAGRILSRHTTRPEQTAEMATTVAWNGVFADGNRAEPGEYRLRIRAYVNGQMYQTYSEPFSITWSD